MRKAFRRVILAGSLAVPLFSANPAAAAFVSALPSTPTLIGVLTAGQTYNVTASGIAYLCNDCNSGQPLEFFANGLPATTPMGAYAPLSPNGLDYDPSGSSYPGTGGYGQGGMGKLVGALLGTFTLTPTGPSDFFTLGTNATFTATVSETLYGIVNDTSYGDNNQGTGYTVDLVVVNAAAVPEPASLSLVALGMLGLARARRKTVAARPVAIDG